MNIAIREAAIADVPRLARIKLAAIHNSMQYKKFVRDQSAEEVYLKETFARCRVLVGSVDAQIVGFIAFDDSYLEQFYVDPLFQNQGIGSQLFKYAQDNTSSLRVAVDNENVDGIRFYERHDFRLVGPIENSTGSTYEWISSE